MKIDNNRTYINIGDFRNIITLRPPTYVQQGRQEVVQYLEQNQIDVYARVMPTANVRELQEANLTYDTVIIVWIRYVGSFKEDWLINYDSQNYTVHKATNINGKNRFLEIIAYTKSQS